MFLRFHNRVVRSQLHERTEFELPTKDTSVTAPVWPEIPRLGFPDFESTIRIPESIVPQTIRLAFGATEILVSGEGELSVGLYRSTFSNLNHQRISINHWLDVVQFKGV